MHVVQLAALSFCVAAMSAAPVLAADNTMMSGGTMSTMKPGEVVTVMGDGHTGTMMADDKMMQGMMKMAKPISCIMIMTGKDGKTYMVTPTTKTEMAECQKMAM